MQQRIGLGGRTLARAGIPECGNARLWLGVQLELRCCRANTDTPLHCFAIAQNSRYQTLLRRPRIGQRRSLGGHVAHRFYALFLFLEHRISYLLVYLLQIARGEILFRADHPPKPCIGG